jgi:hypothetical protein
MKRFALAPVFAALLASCSVTGPETMEIRLEPYLIPCMSWFPTSCMVGKKVGTDTSTVSFHEGEIKGFRFAWGYRHRLHVDAHRIENPPQDGSSIEYALNGKADRTAAPEWEFKTVLHDPTAWSLSGDTLILEGYDRKIRIRDGEDLARLNAVGPGEHPTLSVGPAAGEEWLEGHSVIRP